jgi:membrane-associated PAP2 superfamily phosphatase
VITAFTLYIFCFILKNRIYQIYIFFAVTILGWILGFYQILKGAHFISDTLVAMLLSFLLAQLIARIYYAKINEKI